jgi:hypothetical protein
MSVSTLRAIVAAIKVGNDSYGCRSTPRHPIVRLFEVKRLQRRHLRLIDFQLANEFDDGEPLWCHGFHTEYGAEPAIEHKKGICICPDEAPN